jgi:enamine deaminase RidA (YjgF/YER057c/UK114 family)
MAKLLCSQIGCFISNIRLSQIVYLSGQTCPSALGEQEDSSGTVAGQTRAILQRIDKLLAQAGTDKTHLLTANIWLKDISSDFEAMNKEWIDWVDASNKPTRATVQATLCAPEMLVEIQVTAALPL